MMAKLLVAFLGTASAFKVQTTPVDNALKLRGGNLAGISVGTVNLVNSLYCRARMAGSRSIYFCAHGDARGIAWGGLWGAA